MSIDLERNLKICVNESQILIAKLIGLNLQKDTSMVVILGAV